MLFGTQSQPASLPPGPTPSGQLSDSIRNMCLASQGLDRPPLAPTQRPPVPLFNENQPTTQQCGPCQPGSGGPPPSQMDYLGTQDFITPADQFDLAYDPSQAAAAAAGRPPRSPVALSPGRVKRARKSDPENDAIAASVPILSAPLVPMARHPGAAATGVARPRPPRERDLPMYRSIFKVQEADEDSAFDPWTKKRPTSELPTGRWRREFKEMAFKAQGSFSKVFAARHRLDGMEYAVKRTLRQYEAGCEEFSQFLQEVQILAALPPHPNVVRYYSSWTEWRNEYDPDYLFMQLELCDDSLRGIWGASEISEATVMDMALQIATGLAHCHKHGVAHLDIKPDNIFALDINKDGDTPHYIYKLGDFGQAARLRGAGGCTVPEGDARYIPLERMNGKVDALDKADMFALGLVMLEFSAASPYELPQEGTAYQNLRRGNPPMLPTHTATFQKIIRALLAENPADRPSAERLIKMLSKMAAGSKGTQEPASPCPATAAAEPMQS